LRESYSIGQVKGKLRPQENNSNDGFEKRRRRANAIAWANGPG